MDAGVLAGLNVVVFAVNLPGPATGARLQEYGAQVVKVEPPTGDPFETACPEWYAELHMAVQVVRLDVRVAEPRQALEALLERADVLVTSFRPASLQRLGLDHATLCERYPRLCHVAITGYHGTRAHVAGHDLTYQAHAGLVSYPNMPVTLLADIAGVERGVSAALALVLARARGIGPLYAEVALAHAVIPFAAPIRFGLTTDDGQLGGGGRPFYGLYETKSGVVAVAALEPQFQMRLLTALDIAHVGPGTSDFVETISQPRISSADLTERLEIAFLQRTAPEWEAWAATHDLPIAAVQGASANAL